MVVSQMEMSWAQVYSDIGGEPPMRVAPPNSKFSGKVAFSLESVALL